MVSSPWRAGARPATTSDARARFATLRRWGLRVAIAVAVSLAYPALSLWLGGNLMIFLGGLPDWRRLGFVIGLPKDTSFSFAFPAVIWSPERHVYLAAGWWALTVAGLSGLLIGLIALGLLRRGGGRRTRSAGLAGGVPALFAGFTSCASGPLAAVIGGTAASRIALGPWSGVFGGLSLGLLGLGVWWAWRPVPAADCCHRGPDLAGTEAS